MIIGLKEIGLVSILSSTVATVLTLFAQLWIQPMIAERQFRKTERFAAKQAAYAEAMVLINQLWSSFTWSVSPIEKAKGSGPGLDARAANECHARLILLADDKQVPAEFHKLVTADIGQLNVNDRIAFLNRLRKDLYGDEISGLTLNKDVQYFFDRRAISTNALTQ